MLTAPNMWVTLPGTGFARKVPAIRKVIELYEELDSIIEPLLATKVGASSEGNTLIATTLERRGRSPPVLNVVIRNLIISLILNLKPPSGAPTVSLLASALLIMSGGTVELLLRWCMSKVMTI